MFPKDGEQESEQRQDPTELHDEELDDISAGILGELPEFRGRSVQPDGGGAAGHC